MPDKTLWSIIQVYAPTEGSSEEEIEQFYDTVYTAMDFLDTKHLIVMGDFNAQIGQMRQGEEKIFGKYSHGNRSKRGRKLVEFALEHDLKFTNSMFKRKAHNKWTWSTPNMKHFNEIDYILTNQPSHIHNFDIINNLNFYTDHRMIRCKVIMKVKRSRKFVKFTYQQARSLPTVSREDGKHWEDRFVESVNSSNNVQTQYDNFENEMKSLLKEIPRKKIRTENPIGSSIRELLEERKQMYKSKRTREIKARITEISKQINKTLTKEKEIQRQETFKKYIEKTGGVKKAYRELRNTTQWTANLKNRIGKLTNKRPEIIKEATSFYEELYTSDIPKSLKSLELQNNTTTSYLTPSNSILVSEVEHAIRSQKNDKTPGDDNITNEVLKSLSEPLQRPLQTLFSNIIKTGTTPKQWSKSAITLLHKKGDRSELGNYRPISLISNLYKIFSKIILQRLTNTLDENQPPEQAGFRKNYSTLDHIQVVTQIIQKANEYGMTVYMCFIDFKKAFDSLEFNAIWESLLEQGVDEEYISIIHSIYSKSTAKVRLEREGEEFSIEKGVRQGDPLSPKIFSAVLETIFRNLNWQDQGLNINGEHLSHLRFADDIVVFSESPTSLALMLNDLTRESKKVGLSINTSKTKTLTNGTPQDIVVDGGIIEYVREYTYLGQSVSFENCTGKEVQRRIAISWQKYWSLKEIMKNKQTSIKIKKKIYEVIILPCLTYGCQTWSLTNEEENKLAICQRKMERSMLGIKLSDKVNNRTIRKRTNLCNIISRIRTLKWSWAGHICRMDSTRWTKKVMEWIPRNHKRNRGRPKKRWEDIFRQKCGPDWMRQARQRDSWRKTGEAYARMATITTDIQKNR